MGCNMGVFEEAAVELNAALGMEASPTAGFTYVRKNGNTVLITTGWIGQTRFRIEEQGNSRLEYSDRDYLIPVESLTYEGVKFLPEKGDRIVENFDSPDSQQSFELSAPNDEPVWRHSDPQRTRYRIHCKRMKRNA